VLADCERTDVPVTTAGGRSGVCGASVPIFGGVVLDVTALTGIVAIDDESLLLTVRAGTFGHDLEDELRARGYTLGHWPQSIALSTVGGWLACRGAGQYSTRYGKIEDMVVGIEVVLADGRVVRTGGTPRAAIGPDITQLFVGSEGTLGVITEATLRIHPRPAAERRAAFGFETFVAGLDACRRILRRGATPAVLRLYDGAESARSYATDGSICVLLVLDEGDDAIIDAVMTIVDEECTEATGLDVARRRWIDHRNDVSALRAAHAQGTSSTRGIAARGVVPDIYEATTAALALPHTVAQPPSILRVHRRVSHHVRGHHPTRRAGSDVRRALGRGHGRGAVARRQPQPPPRHRAQPWSLRGRQPGRELHRAQRAQGRPRSARGAQPGQARPSVSIRHCAVAVIDLDRHAVARGVAVAAAIAVPVAVFANVAVDDNAQHSGWIALFSLGVLVGLAVGAAVAARRQHNGTPLTHGIVCALVVFVAVNVFGIVRRSIAGDDIRWTRIASTAVTPSSPAGGRHDRGVPPVSGSPKRGGDTMASWSSMWERVVCGPRSCGRMARRPRHYQAFPPARRHGSRRVRHDGDGGRFPGGTRSLLPVDRSTPSAPTNGRRPSCGTGPPASRSARASAGRTCARCSTA
jgi:FAD/FMN-containing dehydrogenase